MKNSNLPWLYSIVVGAIVGAVVGLVARWATKPPPPPTPLELRLEVERPAGAPTYLGGSR